MSIERGGNFHRKDFLNLSLIVGLALASCSARELQDLVTLTPDPLPVTATYTPEPTSVPTATETTAATETVVSEPTPEEVADYTPETIPDRFIHFGHEWAKTTVEENGAEVNVWRTEGEGMENVDMRFVTLYGGLIENMFVEHTGLGRFHLYLTPLAPFRMRFPDDPAQAAQIGETIINQYLVPEMTHEEAKDAVMGGAEVYSVYGDVERNLLANNTPVYSADGTEIIGKIINRRSDTLTPATMTAPFVNEDGSVIFGIYWSNEWREWVLAGEDPTHKYDEILTPYMEIARAVSGVGSRSDAPIKAFNLEPLAEYLETVTDVAWSDQ